MATVNVPKYFVQFSISPEVPIDDPHATFISHKALSQTSERINPKILEVLENIGRDYVYLQKGQFDGVKCRVSLSIEHGVRILSSTNDKIFDVFKNIQGLKIAAIQSDLEEAGIGNIKKADYTESEEKDAREKFAGKEICFVDLFAYQLALNGLQNPLVIDLELSPFSPTVSGGGITTGYLRHPHLLRDISTQLQGIEQPNICIVGPGLFQMKDSPVSCPQFVELYSLFPNGNFLLLDNDQDALKTLDTQFHKLKWAAYDPFTLRLRTMNSSPHVASLEYKKLIDLMSLNLAPRAIRPKPSEAREMLQGIGPIKPIFVKVHPERIETREFDILTSQLNEEDRFDAIVATMAILNAIDGRNDADPVLILKKFLTSLKEGGTLYIDSFLIDRVSADWASKLTELEEELGYKFETKEVPLSDFDPKIIGKFGTIASGSTVEAERGQVPLITTSSVIAIKKVAR